MTLAHPGMDMPRTISRVERWRAALRKQGSLGLAWMPLFGILRQIEQGEEVDPLQ
jgi:hypothetical protein